MIKFKKFLKKLFYIPDARFASVRLELPKLSVKLQLPRVFGFQAPEIKFGWPRFPVVRIRGGIWKVSLIATGLGLIAVTGIYFATTQGINQAPIYPDSASYDVAQAQRLDRKTLQVGKEHDYGDVPQEQRATQTLNLIVGGARIDQLSFDTISLGKATGLTNAIKVFGTTANTLTCDTVTIDGLEAPSLWLSNSRIHTLTIKDNFADGLSLSPTLGVVSDIEVGSTRGAINIPSVKDSTYDRILIDTSSADSVCKDLKLKDIKVFGTYSGAKSVHLENMDVGELIIMNSLIGDGTGIDVASFTATSTTISNAALTNNIERPITIK
jgi:hypothetical protein